MSVSVQGPDGNTYQFPDGTDKTAAIAYFKKKGIGAQPSTPAKPEGFWNSAVSPIVGAVKGLDPRPTEEEKKQGLTSPYDYALRPFERVVSGQMEQGKQAVASTKEAAKNLDAASVTAAARDITATALPVVGPWLNQAATKTGEQVAEGNYKGAAGTVVGNVALALAPKAGGKILEAVSGKLPEMAAKATRAAAGAGPKTVRDLVKETKANNDAMIEQYGKDLKDARTQETSPTGKKLAMQRGVARLSDKIQDELKATGKQVNAEANRQYVVLKKALKDEESGSYQPVGDDGKPFGPAISVPDRLNSAADESLRGSETAPTIIKDIARRVQNGEVSLTYDDLQGYREEIGRELRKGTLAPDVFDAYKKMMPMIDDAMQEIAQRKGLGKEQLAARNYYRRYAQAFLDKGSPIRKAIESKEAGESVSAFSGADRAGIETLAQFNPELARKINTVRGYSDQISQVKGSEPVIPTRPTEFERVGEREVSGSKKKGVESREKLITNRATWLTVWAGFSILRNLMHGDIADVGGMGEGAMVAGSGLAAAHAITTLLEKPQVMDFLTKATPADVDRIPPQLRGDFPKILTEAQKRGIKVSPGLTKAFTAGAVAGNQKNQ